jgi:transcriptional regulator with XRE-family HTH domain
MKRFGEKLRALRVQHGLTQRELAGILGYRNDGYISLLEAGKKIPTVEFMMKVAQYFHVTLDQLAWDHLPISADTDGDTATAPDNTP